MIKINNQTKNNDGLTLIELLISIVILGIVLAAVTTMIIQAFTVFDSSTRRMSAGQLSELALAEVGSYLRAVTEVLQEPDSTLAPEDSKIYIFNSYYSGETAKINIEFDNSNNQLTLIVNDNEAERTLINNIEAFNINYDSNKEFEIYIRVNDGNNIAEKNITVKSRNL